MRVDDSAVLFRTYVYLGPAGLVAGLLFSRAADLNLLGTALLTAFFTLTLAPAVVWFTTHMAHEMAAVLYSRGDGTTRIPLSQAQALAASGHTADAVKLYGELAAEYPEEPEPLLEAARLSRDELRDRGAAVQFFARALSRQPHGAARATAREVLELIERTEGDLPRSLPALAQIAEVLGECEEGERAARELYRRKHTRLETT